MAGAVANLETILKNAVLIEQHTDKYKGTIRENPHLLRTCVLLGVYEDGTDIIPVQFEIKETDDTGGHLYIVVSLTKIEAGVFGSTQSNNSTARGLLPASTYSLSDIFANVNVADKHILKYVPDGFLSEEQKMANQEALEEDRIRISKIPKKESTPAKEPVNGNNSQNNQENDLSFLWTTRARGLCRMQNKQLNIDTAANTPYNKENGGAGNGSTGQLYGTAGTGVRAGRNGNETGQELEIRRRNGREDLPDTGVILLSPKSQQLLTKRGVVNIELHDSSNDNAVFSFALQQARNADLQNGWAVTPKDSVKLDESGTRTFLSSNGNTGFAIAPVGDIQAVFANKTLGAPKGTNAQANPE